VTTSLHRVMHGVAIKKHCSAADIVDLTEMPLAKVESELVAADASGRLVQADGRYMLSPAGHMILLGEYSRFYAGLRSNEDFVAAYDRFEIVNNELKQLITEWQTIEIAGKRVLNDHSDKEHDDKTIGRLGDLHERFEPILNTMISGESRLRCYSKKLESALEKAEDGESQWVSSATIESYHTVWFEMHEDLLRLLGRVREE
jgi:hypothetical protein